MESPLSHTPAHSGMVQAGLLMHYSQQETTDSLPNNHTTGPTPDPVTPIGPSTSSTRQPNAIAHGQPINTTGLDRDRF
ncbi:hypothetical protein SKAU_G00216410 [Synaphobranchus kaupii]|uniref:Uncharacterized protein n=1 Tax=Synaphobranchus kaupii TaxID=118154 RepID=A0A9Q1F9X4_SYNKA|nr:hypothetical protein SKAU_G00216410 [Synaphobranchus kaupii]